jgi:hypothetical protein
MKKKFTKIAQYLALFFCLAVANNLHGEDYLFIANSGSWNDPNNWEPQGIPGANDNVYVLGIAGIENPDDGSIDFPYAHLIVPAGTTVYCQSIEFACTHSVLTLLEGSTMTCGSSNLLVTELHLLSGSQHGQYRHNISGQYGNWIGKNSI